MVSEHKTTCTFIASKKEKKEKKRVSCLLGLESKVTSTSTKHKLSSADQIC